MVVNLISALVKAHTAHDSPAIKCTRGSVDDRKLRKSLSTDLRK